MSMYASCKALIIGVGRYADPQYDLSYARSDAEAMAEMLGNEFGFDQVWTLYDNDATRQSIIRFFEQDLQRTDEDDGLLIFFAGHGITVTSAIGDDRGFLVPHDGDPKRPYANLSLTTIRDDYLPMIPAKHVFLIVDACYGGLALRDVATIERPKTIDDAVLAELTRRDRKVRQVLAAGTKDQRVLDGGLFGHSVFTGRLIEALREANPYITADHVGVHVRDRVSRDGADRRHHQTPQFGYLFGGDGSFVFHHRAKTRLAPKSARRGQREPNSVQECGDVRTRQRLSVREGSKACSKCGDPIKPEWKICPSCGNRLALGEAQCAHCGKPMKQGWKACPECGSKGAGEERSRISKASGQDIPTLFVEALKADDYETAQDLLDGGADINEPCHAGFTALYSACVEANVEKVRWLLSRGAEPNRDLHGFSPLQTTATGTVEQSKKQARLDIMSLLIAAGADVNYVENGLSVVDLSGCAEAQQLLMQHGARRGRKKLMF